MSINCIIYRRLLIPYSEGSLDERRRARMERHISGCERCRAELEMIRSVSGALRCVESPAMEPAHDLWAKVSARIADEPPPARHSTWLTWLPAGAAAVLTAVIALSVWHPSPAPVRLAEGGNKSGARVAVTVGPPTKQAMRQESRSGTKAAVTTAPRAKRVVVSEPADRVALSASPGQKPTVVAKASKAVDLLNTKDAYAARKGKEEVAMGRAGDVASPEGHVSYHYTDALSDAKSVKASEASPSSPAPAPPALAVPAERQASAEYADKLGGAKATVTFQDVNSKSMNKLDKCLAERVSEKPKSAIKVSILVSSVPSDAVARMKSLGLRDIAWDAKSSIYTASAPSDKLKELSELDFVKKVSAAP